MQPTSGLFIDADYDEEGPIFFVRNAYGDVLYSTYDQLDAYSWMEAQD